MRLVTDQLKRAGKGKVVALGSLFGCPAEMNRLRAQGLGVIETPEQAAPDQIVALPAWGAPPQVVQYLQENGIRLLNTTCPRDSLSHNLAYRLAREGYVVVVVGRADTVASEALISRVRQGRRDQMSSLGEDPPRLFSGVVVDATAGKKPDLRAVPEDVSHVAVVAQANASMEAYRAVVSAAAARFEEVRAYKTVCRSLVARFQEADRLAAGCDVLIVVGGDSIETDELVNIGRHHDCRVKVVGTVGSLDEQWLEGARRVGVVPCSATPDWLLVSVVEELRRLGDAEVEEGPATG